MTLPRMLPRVLAIIAGQLGAVILAQTALTITTAPPLFDGTVGTPYVQTFSATGGAPPYTWAITSGSTGGLSLDASSGTLRGTPSTAGTFSFSIQVTDSAGSAATGAFSLVINSPHLSIATASPLPGGTVGTAYSQKFAVSGGTAPYSWVCTVGSVPGLTFDPASVTLSGFPTTSGTFGFTLQVVDSANLTASRAFTLTIAPGAMTITTARRLADATLGSPFSQQIAAAGGAPPYVWSANGLPGGLSINASTGLITGSPTAAGNFTTVVITVTDSALKNYQDLFQITVILPAVPEVTITGLPATASPARQLGLQISIRSAYPAPIIGQAILSFVPDQGNGDGTIQFASGGLTAAFTIPAGATSATATVPLAIQTGSVAGTIGVSLRLQTGGVDITPVPAPSAATRVDRAAPSITTAKATTSGNTISIQILGFSTALEVTQAVFAFSAASGQTLQPSSASITVQVDSLFAPWFQDSSHALYGSQFLYTQPFTVAGQATAVIPMTVTLINRVGSVTANISAQ